MELEVTLSASDCACGLESIASRQTGIFLAPSFSTSIIDLFGANSKKGDHFTFRLSKYNLASNILHHFWEKTQFWKVKNLALRA